MVLMGSNSRIMQKPRWAWPGLCFQRHREVCLTRRSDGIADGSKRLIGIRTQRGNGGDAYHDDERQHDGILDRRRPIFLGQEIPYPRLQFAGGLFLSATWRSALSHQRTHGFASSPCSEFAISR